MNFFIVLLVFLSFNSFSSERKFAESIQLLGQSNVTKNGAKILKPGLLIVNGLNVKSYAISDNEDSRDGLCNIISYPSKSKTKNSFYAASTGGGIVSRELEIVALDRDGNVIEFYPAASVATIIDIECRKRSN